FSSCTKTFVPLAMFELLKSPIGRLRILGLIEGITLLLLVFIGMPLKYFMDSPDFVRIMGPIHGAAFGVFVMVALGLCVTYGRQFRKHLWKILLASFIPFGNFYVDSKILRNWQEER